MLVPFSYFGVPDIVEYAQIPWRSGRFDEEELTTAVATQARAQNALDQLRQRGGQRAIGFCVSRLHADFMTKFFLEQGLRAVAVHSGETSAPRTSSLQALAAGELDIIFAVDMFNEGVDVPEIDTVLMLRPTESPVIWLQQFGRGLRKADGKDRLSVIDYIGNHRIFLTKARTLLQVGEGERALAQRLAEIRRGEVGLPEGCEITYDLEALDILERLIRKTDEGDELEAFYRDFRDRHGVRPTALETYHAGFDPRRTGHGGWFGFVSDQGDLNEADRAAYNDHSGFLASLETTEMTRSYKMLVLRAMIEEDAFPGAVEIDRLVNRFAHLTARNPRLRSDVSADVEDISAVKRLLEKYPLTAWAEVDSGRWFTWDGSVFSTRFRAGEQTRKPLIEMTSEIVDWRLARHLEMPKEQPRPEPEEQPVRGLDEDPARSHRPELWREYKRDEVPPLFGATFNPAAWNSGIVALDKDMILLVTLKKGSLSSGNEYEDRFEDPLTFHWQSQNQTRQASKHGRIINGTEPGWHVHLFVRSSKLRNGKAAPFRYCGILQFMEWEGEKPISVRWRLQERVPDHLHRIFGIA